MRLRINGELKLLELKEGNQSLLAVINRIGYDPRTIVVEFNGLILRSNEWRDQQVKEGDVIEIVTIVGGGS